MSRLDKMIANVRKARIRYKVRGRGIEAAACAIREKALLDARAAVLGKVEPGYEFRNVIG